ncbi:MAG TPA: response regulator transcription factor [Vicinamibacterales bacterium]
MSISVVLVDDHPIVLQGLQHLFARQPDITVLATCATVAEGLTAARTSHPDVMVLDLRMPDGGGLALLDSLNREALGVKTVILTAAISDTEVAQALQKGIGGLVLKESAPEQLLECVRSVHAGTRWIDPDTLGRAAPPPPQRNHAAAERAATLTSREREVVKMIAAGLRNRDIGERLSISENTVKVHLHNIYEKLGVEGRMELLLLAQELGMV